MKDIKWYKNRVKILQGKPQPAQKSKEWFEIRNNLITASEAASCLTMSERTCESYVKAFNIKKFKYNANKCANTYENKMDYLIKKSRASLGENVFIDSIYTLWGKKYEDVAVNLYKKLKNVQVYEFGLLLHPRLKWLGASPDGITENGVMLEIKCPYSRKIKDTEPPLHYYIQVQLQLETAMLDEADFLECEIKEFDTFEEYIQSDSEHKGILLEKVDGSFIYQNSDQDPFLWANDQILVNTTLKIYYFHIVKYNIINIKRDPEWFERVKPELKSVHVELKNYLKNPDKLQELLNIKNKKHLNTIINSKCSI